MMHGDGALIHERVFAYRLKCGDTVSIGGPRPAIGCIHPMIHQYRGGPILVLNLCRNLAVSIGLGGIAY